MQPVLFLSCSGIATIGRALPLFRTNLAHDTPFFAKIHGIGFYRESGRFMAQYRAHLFFSE